MLPLINKFFTENQLDFTLYKTAHRNHAAELSRQFSDIFDVIVIVGGDGTLNEIVNGFNLESKSSVLILPIGTGNDFARNLGLSADITEDLKLLLNKNQKTVESDVVNIEYTLHNLKQIHSKRYINSLGIGFDAYVAYLNQTNKTFSGIVSYIIAVIKALFTYKTANITLNYNNIKCSGRKLLTTIGNGITSGGGFYLTPKAKIDDGYLDLISVDNISIPQIMRYLPLALLNKIYGVEVAVFDKFKEIEIEIEGSQFVHADGEIVSDSIDKMKIYLSDKKIKFISNKLNVSKKTKIQSV